MDQAAAATFEAFARARMAVLLRFGYVLAGTPQGAADLVQDALERTMLAWPRLLRQDDPEAYVRRVMVNRHLSLWRRLRRERLGGQLPEAAYQPATGMDPGLLAELKRLPPRQRAVLFLRFYEDLSERQTAEILGCAVGTVKSQAARALATLRSRVGSESEGTWTA